jgi:hypothetical protein
MTDIPSCSFGSVSEWHCLSDADLLTLFNTCFPLPTQGSWTIFHLNYKICMCVISAMQMKGLTLDEWWQLQRIRRQGPLAHIRPAFGNGRLPSGSILPRMSPCNHRLCHAGSRRRIRQRTVGPGFSAITAVGQRIALACGTNPTKLSGGDKMFPWMHQILDGWCKEDPPKKKQLPVEADDPEYLLNYGQGPAASEVDWGIEDLVLIMFYYLLSIGEYTVKGQWEETKQTVQFKMEDITFFQNNAVGQLRCLPHDSPVNMILLANRATMKPDNQKNGWKGVCVYQEHNREHWHCPVRSLGHQYSLLHTHNSEDISLGILAGRNMF